MNEAFILHVNRVNWTEDSAEDAGMFVSLQNTAAKNVHSPHA